jgi:hypothetical protein
MEEKKDVNDKENKEIIDSEHEIPQKVIDRQKHPWEHFKQSQNFKKNMKAHSKQRMNRRIIGK